MDDYADVLGSRLVNAIKSGTASSDQLKTAIEKIGKSATGGKADIKQLTDAVDTVDDGQMILLTLGLSYLITGMFSISTGRLQFAIPNEEPYILIRVSPMRDL